jgi:hypothetical protein
MRIAGVEVARCEIGLLRGGASLASAASTGLEGAAFTDGAGAAGGAPAG